MFQEKEDKMPVQRKIGGVDDALLKEIIHNHANALLKYCYGILCNYADAEDAVQMTFIKLYQHQEKIETLDNLSTYLYKIAYRTSIDILRKSKRQLLLGDSEYEAAFIEQRYDYEFPEELRNALFGLKPIERGLMINLVIDGMSYKELAKLYGRPEVYLRKKYERARAKLSKWLSSDISKMAVKGVYHG